MEETMFIVDATCWKCGTAMKVALIKSNDYEKRDGTTCGPEKFSAEELELAISKGAMIKEHHSFTREHTYLANTCGNCDAFVGAFYLFQNYFQPAERGDYQFEMIEL